MPKTLKVEDVFFEQKVGTKLDSIRNGSKIGLEKLHKIITGYEFDLRS